MSGKKMKLGIFMEQYGLGGVEVQLVNMINNWPAPGEEIYFITNSDNKGVELFSSLLKRDCRIELIKLRSYCYFSQKVNALKTASPLKRLIRYSLELFKYPLFILDICRLAVMLKRYKLDAFISDNGGYPASDSCRASVFASFLCGIKRRYMIVHHAATPPAKLYRIFEWSIDKLLQQVAQKFITVSEASRQALLAKRYFSRENIEMIHNGIDETMSTDRRIDLKASYRIPDNRKLIGIMGNLDSYKGHRIMVEAVPQILREFPDMHFIFVGSLFDQSWHRDNADRVIALIEKMGLKSNITVTGYLKGQPQEIIDQFDILAMPTLDFEGFGLTLAEAMILRKPIVASSVGAIPEVLIDGQSGILVSPGDPVALANTLCRLLGDPVLMKRLGQNARQRYEEKFTAKIMANKYYELVWPVKERITI